MRERVALGCLNCEFSCIRKTPDTQEGLREMVREFLYCPECHGTGIVQRASIDESGTHHLYM